MTQPRDLTFEMIDAFYGGGGGGGGGSADGGQDLGGNWDWGGGAPSSGGGGGGRVAGGGGGSSGPDGSGGYAEGSVYGTYDNMMASYGGQDATSFNLMDSSFGGGRSGSSATSYSPSSFDSSTAINTSLANLPVVGGFNASTQQPAQGFAIPGTPNVVPVEAAPTAPMQDPLAAALGPVGPAGFGLMGPVGLDPLAAATIAASRPSRGAFSLTGFGPAVEEEPLSNVMFDAAPMAQQFGGFGPAPSLNAEMFSPAPVSSQGALSRVSRPSMPTRNVEVSRVVSTPSAPLAGSAPALDSRSFSAPIGGGYADMGFTIYDANDGADITFGSGNVEGGFAPAPSVAPTSLAPAELAAPVSSPDPFGYDLIPSSPSVPSVTQPAPAQLAPTAQPTGLPDYSTLALPEINPAVMASVLAAARAPDVDEPFPSYVDFGMVSRSPNGGRFDITGPVGPLQGATTIGATSAQQRDFSDFGPALGALSPRGSAEIYAGARTRDALRQDVQRAIDDFGAQPGFGNVARVVDAGPGYTIVEYDNGRIERREGMRASRNNNPGNIEYGPFAQRHGAIGMDYRGNRARGFAVFPDVDAGRAAKAALLDTPAYANRSIRAGIERYAPAFENNSALYAQRVAAAAGVPVNTRIGELTPAQRAAFSREMERIEGNVPFTVAGVLDEGLPVSFPSSLPAAPETVLAPTPPSSFEGVLARANAVSPDESLAALSMVNSPVPTGIPATVPVSSPAGSGLPDGAQMRAINDIAAPAPAPTVDPMYGGVVGSGIMPSVSDFAARGDELTPAEIAALDQAMLDDYIENEIARQSEFTVPTARQEQAVLDAIMAELGVEDVSQLTDEELAFAEAEIARQAEFTVPTARQEQAVLDAINADLSRPMAGPPIDDAQPLAADREVPPVEDMPAPPGWDEAELGPWENVPDSTRAAIFGALTPEQREQVLAEMEREAVEEEDPAQLRELMQTNPSDVIPGMPYGPNAFERAGIPGRIFDAALGVVPIVGPLNTISGLLGGPSLGRFVNENMIPARDPRHFETMMNLPQFSTDTSYDSGDDDVFVSSRGGGDRAPAPPPPAPEPVRRGALSDLRRRYLGAGDDLRRYGMGPERVYYDEEPVEMAEGGYVDPFAMTDPLMDAGDYINEAAGRRRDEREARAPGALSVVSGAMSDMLGQGGMLNPGRLVEPTAEGVVGALDMGAEMLRPGPGIDAGLERLGTARDAYRDGRYMDAMGEAVSGVLEAGADIPMLGTFAGPMARTADLDALARAQAMDEEWADRRAIWDATGWFKGPDGQWRFEIDDSASRLTDNAELFTMDFAVDAPFRDVLDHRALTDAYDIPNRTRVYQDSSRTGSYSPDDGSIIVRVPDENEARSVLLHEIQHAIQSREGFASGGNPRGNVRQFIEQADRELFAVNSKLRDLRRAMKGFEEDGDIKGLQSAEYQYRIAMQQKEEILERATADPVGVYRRLAGEVEARNVQTRRDMTPAQRRARPPWETQDVPDDMQIIIRRD